MIEVINLALSRLGSNRITSIDDPSKEAGEAKAIYLITLEAEMAANKWAFCAKRTVLAPLAEAPVFGFTFQYQLPSDFLTLYDLEKTPLPLVGGPILGKNIEWEIEGQKILTNYGKTLKIIYGYRISDFNELPALFKDAYAWRLAADLAEPLTASTAKQDTCMRRYGLALKNAKRANCFYKQPINISSGSWEMSSYVHT